MSENQNYWELWRQSQEENAELRQRNELLRRWNEEDRQEIRRLMEELEDARVLAARWQASHASQGDRLTSAHQTLSVIRANIRNNGGASDRTLIDGIRKVLERP